MNYKEYLEHQKTKFTCREITCEFMLEKIEWVKNLAEVYYNQWRELEDKFEEDKRLAKESGKTFKENEVSATRRIAAQQEFETVNSIMDGELYYYISTVSIGLALDRVITNYKLFYKQSSKININTLNIINQLLNIKKEFKEIDRQKFIKEKEKTEKIHLEISEMDKKLNFRR